MVRNSSRGPDVGSLELLGLAGAGLQASSRVVVGSSYSGATA